jgi:hypothetical protein
MRLRRGPTTVALLAVLTGTLVGSTGYTLYRIAMGPQQCCKKHCHHDMEADAARDCCRTHLSTAPTAASKDPLPKDGLLPLTVVAFALPAPLLPVVLHHDVRSTLAGRAPPGRSLVAQHTALLV